MIVDNVRVYDIALLELMPAGDILTIEVLSALDATTYYGASSTSGAIIIQTIMETLAQQACLVSDLGLREGVLITLAARVLPL